MLAAAPAAPAAPAAAITVGLIMLAFAWIALYGLKYGYDYSLGALLRKLADSTRGIRWIGGRIADVFEDIDSFIQARIADGIEAVEASSARLWDGLAWLVRQVGDALYEFGGDVHDAIYGVVHGEIPAQVRTRTAPIADGLSALDRVAAGRARAEAQARARGIDALNRDLTAEALARERGIDYIATRVNSLVLPRIRALDQALADVVGFTRRNLRIRIGNLERLLGAGLLTAAAVRALDLRFPFWKCTNVRNFNRFLCRMPVGLFDLLLGVGIPILVFSDICRIAAIIRNGADAFAPVLTELVVRVGAATDCASIGPAPALPLAAAVVPASDRGFEL